MSDAPEKIVAHVRDFDVDVLGPRPFPLDHADSNAPPEAALRISLSELGEFVNALADSISETGPSTPAFLQTAKRSFAQVIVRRARRKKA